MTLSGFFGWLLMPLIMNQNRTKYFVKKWPWFFSNNDSSWWWHLQRGKLFVSLMESSLLQCNLFHYFLANLHHSIQESVEEKAERVFLLTFPFVPLAISVRYEMAFLLSRPINGWWRKPLGLTFQTGIASFNNPTKLANSHNVSR